METALKAKYEGQFREAYAIKVKQDRYAAVGAVKDAAVAEFTNDEADLSKEAVANAWAGLFKYRIIYKFLLRIIPRTSQSHNRKADDEI